MTPDAQYPTMPEKSYLGDDASYGYDEHDMRAYADQAIAHFLERTGQYVTNDATREAAIAHAIAEDRAARSPASMGGVSVSDEQMIRSLWQTIDTGDSDDDVMAFARAVLALAQPQQPDAAEAVASFQDRVHPWMMACFGEEISADRKERNHRFFEEGTELVQSTGMTRSEAHQLVDYVYNRPVGEPAQEVGGVMVTLAALCLANGLDMHDAAEVELARIWTKVDVIRAKQAAKPKHSPLPEHAAPAQVTGAAEDGQALERMRHVANEWADMAANGLQWIRNIKDGISKPDDALANMLTNLRHCREVNDAAPAHEVQGHGGAVRPIGHVESAMQGAGGFHVRLATGVDVPSVGAAVFLRAPAEAGSGQGAQEGGEAPTHEQLCEMAYLLRMARRGDVIPVQWLEMLKRQFVAAMAAASKQPTSRWLPIETAPKDGTEVLITNGVVVTFGHWLYAPPSIREKRDVDGRYIDQEESDGYNDWIDFHGGIPNPTGWMPVPVASALATAPASDKGDDSALLANLVSQIDKCNPVDDHGHNFKMNAAYLAAKESL